MNSKRAKQLRRQVKTLGLPKEATYTEERKALWGSFPYIKNTTVIDRIKLGLAFRKTTDRKIKTILNGSHWYRKYLRYISGKPIKLALCERQVYQQMKKKFKRTMVS